MMQRAFEAETAAMRPSAFTGATQPDWSFRVGLAFVILFAAGQLFGVGYYAIRKPGRTARTATSTRVASVPQPTPAILPTVAPAPTAAATAPPSIAATPAATVAASPSATAAAVATVDRMVKDAVALRDRGDMTTALARLQEAAQREPKNATVLSEMATTYEAMGIVDRSNETWRRVEELGPASGPAYALAELKLRRGTAATPAPTAPPAESSPAQATAAAAPSPAVGPSRTGAEGIPEGSTFGISEVLATESPDPDSDTNLMLRISVKKRPNAVVDHTKVKIQVFFYDTVDDKDIKLTDAEVNYEWLTPNHDWAGPNPEVLAVTYLRPKNKARTQEEALSAAAGAVIPGKKNRVAKPSSPDSTGRRAYLGYIVRVYYNDKLQGVRSDPTKLLNLFPAPNSPTSP